MTRFRSVKHPELEKALWLWIVQSRAQNSILSVHLITEKAMLFHSALCNIENCSFEFSRGWFQKFKERHSLRFRTICGEKLSADTDSIPVFKEQLMKVIKDGNFALDHIYNCDESALFWRLLPNKTYALQTERDVPGHKNLKDRVTFMPCCNVTGNHKVLLQVIGKSKMPRCFNKRSPTNVIYMASQKGWQTKFLFRDWFDNYFVPSVKNYAKKNNTTPKALLIIDNCSAHNESISFDTNDGLIKVIFLPPNVTSEIQPLDQNVIMSIKNKYRKIFLQKLLINEQSIMDSIKKMTLIDGINILAEAWDQVDPNLIFKSWSNLLSDLDEYKELKKTKTNNIEDDSINNLTTLANKVQRKLGEEPLTVEDLQQWTEVNCDDSPVEILTDKNIIDIVSDNVVNENQNWVEQEDVETYECDNNDNATFFTKRNTISLIEELMTVMDQSDVDRKDFLLKWKNELLNNLIEKL